MASVVLESVSKVFPGGVWAVNRLDLEVRDGELVVLLGPSGSGKSTTLRLIAGLEEVTSGEIRIGERVVNDAAPKDRNIAMVFQNCALYPHMSVYKNMAFGLQLRYGGDWLERIWKRLTNPAEAAELAAKRRGIREQVRQTAQVLGIEHLLERMPRQLSGGERQRVALGRAMVRQPAVFLFDEPLSDLDARLRLEMRRELNQLHRRLRATMIYVTHDQTEALVLGERVAVMDCGEIQQIGTPSEVYDRPRNQFVAGFLGSPPMNFARGHLMGDETGASFQGHGLNVRLPPDKTEKLTAAANGIREVVLGVRPEDVALVVGQPSPETAIATYGTVAVVESIGDSTLVHVDVTGPPREGKNYQSTIVTRTESHTAVKPGDTVGLAVDPARIHLFDPRSGENLTLGREAIPA